MALLKIVDHYVGHFKYMRTILMACCLLIVVGGIGFGYHWYRTSYNQNAHMALAEAIELFDRADKESKTDLWDETDRALSQGYSDYTRSSLAPYFLAFQAQVALRRNDAHAIPAKARDLLQKALQEMSSSMPFYEIYRVQLARMNADSGIKELEEAGSTSLKEIANDAKSSERGMALYYIGLRPFETGDREQAVLLWAPLFKDADFVDSLWAQMAQAKLDYWA